MKLLEAIMDAFSTDADASCNEREHHRGEFITRDEQIIRSLAEGGGYAWQGEIATTLGWSKATTSRTLSGLEDAQRITRYQIGRQKVVCLPDREPECLRGDRKRTSAEENTFDLTPPPAAAN